MYIKEELEPKAKCLETGAGSRGTWVPFLVVELWWFLPPYRRFASGCNADFVRRRGHRTATTEALAAAQRTQAVCLLFSPELFIPSICVTLSLRNVMVEMGECVLLSHLSTDSECALQLPGVFSASLHSHLQLAPCRLEHMPSPGGAEWSQPPAGSGMTDSPRFVLLKDKRSCFCQELSNSPALIAYATYIGTSGFRTPTLKCPLHGSRNPSPGQTGNTLDTSSIRITILGDSLD